jgi:hypothetical protein
MTAPRWLDKAFDGKVTVRLAICFLFGLVLLALLVHPLPVSTRQWLFGWSFIAPLVLSNLGRGWWGLMLFGPLTALTIGAYRLSLYLLPIAPARLAPAGPKTLSIGPVKIRHIQF